MSKGNERRNDKDFMSIYGAYKQYNKKKRSILKNNGNVIITKINTFSAGGKPIEHPIMSKYTRKSFIDFSKMSNSPNPDSQKYSQLYSKRNVHEISDLIMNTK